MGTPQFFALDEPDLAFLGEGFDLVFTPQGGGITGLRFPEQELHGTVGSRVLASLPGVMGRDAGLHVLGDAGIEGTIGTFSDVQMPAVRDRVSGIWECSFKPGF
jgi:hypothetical protein